MGSEDYFPTDAGIHFAYSFDTDGVYTSGSRFVTYQQPETGRVATYLYSSDEDGDAPSYGYGHFTAADDSAYIDNHLVTGNRDHRGYHYFVRLPQTITPGVAYVLSGITFSPRLAGTARGYDDVLILDFDASAVSNDQFRGTGSIYLARDVGMVYLEFTHTEAGRFGESNQGFSYTLSTDPQQATQGSLTGTVEDGSPAVAVAGAIVNLGQSTGFYSTDFQFATTDQNGDFAFSLYYVLGAPIARIVIGIDDDASIDEFGVGTRERATIRVVTPVSAADLSLGTIDQFFSTGN